MLGSSTPSELDAWVRASAPRAVAYAISLLGDVHQAEDIVQDCFGRLLARADVYNLPQDGLKLLMTAITNACINYRTRRKKNVSLSARDDDAPGLDPVDRATAAPDEAVSGRELEHQIAAGLAKLPVNQRAALELKALGHSQQEIAAIMAISTSNVGVLIYRARATMAEYLAPYLGENS